MSAHTFSTERDETAECYAAITRELDLEALREQASPRRIGKGILMACPQPRTRRGTRDA